MKEVTIGKRQTVVAWWIFYKTDTMTAPTPDVFESLIAQAEDDLRLCDSILAEQYDEYVPQF